MLEDFSLKFLGCEIGLVIVSVFWEEKDCRKQGTALSSWLRLVKWKS